MYALCCQLSARPSAEVWDLVSGLLYQFHSQGIEEAEEPPPQGEDALVAANEFELALEPGVLLPPESFKAYFDNRRDAEHAIRAITPALSPYSPAFEVLEVEEKNYAEIWKENFQPIHTNPFWLIRATWHEIKPKADEKELIIEPGMAFGTGSHETTRSCLELMADATASAKLGKKSKALDFGCGSGILSVGLKKLGIGEVFAVDIDPLAIDSTRQNAALNEVELTINISSESAAEKFKNLDGIVANVLKNTLLDFAPKFQAWLKPGGFLILSGLLVEQESAIMAAYNALGFKLERKLTNNYGEPNLQNTWITLWLTRQ